MEGREHRERPSPHSRPQGLAFRQTFTTPAPNQGKTESARQYLEDQGIVRPQSGHKRKNMDGNEDRAFGHNRANPYVSNLFKRSTYSATPTPTPTPEPRFKRPQPLQRRKLEASRSHDISMDDVDGMTAGDVAVKRRRIGEPSSSPSTSQTSTSGPVSVSPSSAVSHSLVPLQTSRGANNYSPSQWRDSLTTSTAKVPTAQTPASSSFPTGPIVRKPDVSAIHERASSPQSPSFRPLKKRSWNGDRSQGPIAASARQQINVSGSRFTNADNWNLPALDRRLKEPPPDLESLNRLLHQVPGILIDLHKKQEQLIRDLVTKVSASEERVRILEIQNTNLQEDVSAKSRIFAEELNTGLATMEERMSTQENQIAALPSENEQLRLQLCGTRENPKR